MYSAINFALQGPVVNRALLASEVSPSLLAGRLPARPFRLPQWLNTVRAHSQGFNIKPSAGSLQNKGLPVVMLRVLEGPTLLGSSPVQAIRPQLAKQIDSALDSRWLTAFGQLSANDQMYARTLVLDLIAARRTLAIASDEALIEQLLLVPNQIAQARLPIRTISFASSNEPIRTSPIVGSGSKPSEKTPNIKKAASKRDEARLNRILRMSGQAPWLTIKNGQISIDQTKLNNAAQLDALQLLRSTNPLNSNGSEPLRSIANINQMLTAFAQRGWDGLSEKYPDLTLYQLAAIPMLLSPLGAPTLHDIQHIVTNLGSGHGRSATTSSFDESVISAIGLDHVEGLATYGLPSPANLISKSQGKLQLKIAPKYAVLINKHFEDFYASRSSKSYFVNCGFYNISKSDSRDLIDKVLQEKMKESYFPADPQRFAIEVMNAINRVQGSKLTVSNQTRSKLIESFRQFAQTSTADAKQFRQPANLQKTLAETSEILALSNLKVFAQIPKSELREKFIRSLALTLALKIHLPQQSANLWHGKKEMHEPLSDFVGSLIFNPIKGSFPDIPFAKIYNETLSNLRSTLNQFNP